MSDIEFNHDNRKQHEKAAREFISLQVKAGVVASDFLEVFMDLSAADGVNGNYPIDWAGMFQSCEVGHDVGGICRHIDRSTGRIGGCFVPRCTVRAETTQ